MTTKGTKKNLKVNEHGKQNSQECTATTKHSPENSSSPSGRKTHSKATNHLIKFREYARSMGGYSFEGLSDELFPDAKSQQSQPGIEISDC